jgi:hypothetical protein
MESIDVFCREASLSAAEPLFGTAAADTELWIVIEVSTPWGAKGVEDSGVPAHVLTRLNRFTSEHPRARVQLMRKPERSLGAHRVYLAHSGERDTQVQSLQLPTLDEVALLDFEAFAAGEVLAGAQVVEEPVYLVCVHGKRDRCCAQHGMPLYTALSALAPEHTFQTTHLGGHRFAATMLVLPEGVSYGRVCASEAQAIVTAHRQGKLYDLERLRGRTTYAPAVQAAEYWVRKQLGELGLSALTLRGVETLGPVQRVTFQDQAGAAHSIAVERKPLGPVVSSCGAHAKPVDQFVVLRLGSPQRDG